MTQNYFELQKEINNINFNKDKSITFLEIINKPTREILISKYLSFLIDEHNISRKLIIEIIKFINPDSHYIDNLFNNAVLESIDTEFAISKNNRIDILIRYSTFWVIIENKIFAWESKPNQTTIYEESINKINVDHLPVFYIYLKPNYNTSTPSNKHFKILYYSNLLDIIKTITENDLGDNKKNYIFLEDFSHLIERFLMNNLNLDSEEIKFYLDNKGKLDHIISNYKAQCKKVLTMLVEAIKSKFPDYIVHQTKTFIQVFKSTWENNKNTGIHFEILAIEPNFENLINNKAFELSFDIHNEQNTKNKYKNIKKETITKAKFLFNNFENILKSIERILIIIEQMIEKHSDLIDKEILKNKI